MSLNSKLRPSGRMTNRPMDRRQQFISNNPTARDRALAERPQRPSSEPNQYGGDRDDEEYIHPNLQRSSRNPRRSLADVLPKLAEIAKEESEATPKIREKKVASDSAKKISTKARDPREFTGEQAAKNMLIAQKQLKAKRVEDLKKARAVMDPAQYTDNPLNDAFNDPDDPDGELIPDAELEEYEDAAVAAARIGTEVSVVHASTQPLVRNGASAKQARILEEVLKPEKPPRTKYRIRDEPAPNLPAVIPMVPDKSALEVVLKSRFGDRSNQILSLLDSDDTTDGAVSLLSRNLLQMLVDILPIAENYVRQSGGARGMQNLTLLSSQIRDALVDLQALRDKGSLGKNLMANHIQPVYMNIAVQVMSSFTLITNFAQSRMSEEDYREFRKHVESTQRQLSDWMNISYYSLEATVVQSMT